MRWRLVPDEIYPRVPKKVSFTFAFLCRHLGSYVYLTAESALSKAA